ncbi:MULTISPECIES: GDP-mannose 4,6-dehydratase [unclassified Cupriavidus]|uniref:GDP-mannose 4,6-dehydratase n=1 Tax=unclassified Cupriavidus TaxID=2640874 RepID=UPI0004199D73|nr:MULTISPECIES: GDP-mannose 4,6-dehydratase [unclassified Cupriavidus]MBP0633987.1 GDP-mannose 4,6-dehydratase [Cupriavidus sp. AcVe19-6a]
MASPSKKAVPRALITGARGFTGHYLSETLRQAGVGVMGASVHPDVAATDDIPLDVTDLDQCRRVIDEQRPDYIAHLAAISYVAHADELAFYRVNVLGTLNLLQACADVGHQPAKILIASSANVYGNACEGVIEESQQPQPVNHYAASKVAMEYMVRTWFDRLPIIVTRPFNYTGVGQAEHFLVPKIVSHFKRGERSIELGNLDVTRDFSDVRTVASIYAALLDGPACGEMVNVCSGQPFSLRDIIAVVEQLAGYSIEVHVNPAFVRPNEVRMLVGSTRKLESLVPGLERPAFEETLRWMYAG